jgi:TRAP-type C4-dicarboxylate transport system permease small subunit
VVKFITAVCHASGVLSGLLLFGSAVVITIEIVARYLGAPTSWGQDSAMLMVIIGAFLSPASIMIDDGHVRVDVFTGQLSEATQKRLVRLTLSVATIYAIVLIWTGIDLTWQSYQIGLMTTGLLRIPMWISQIALPIGAVLLLGAMIVRIREVKLTHLSAEIEEHFGKE